MRYYVVSDTHGFYTQFIEALTKAGWFEDKEPHKLIMLGDLFDRGNEPCELERFVLELMEKEQVILVKGNHESLFQQFIYEDDGLPFSHHISNGTFNTALRLTRINKYDALSDNYTFALAAAKTKYNTKIIPSMKDYFETEHYIFVHGWIPCKQEHFSINGIEYIYKAKWRKSGQRAFEASRWINGMDAYKTVKEPGKTIVCGHWNSSYGHSKYEHKGTEYDENADFSPFYDDGIIAIDACTACSKLVNCIVLEDEPLDINQKNKVAL